jgi:3-phenylpropionate/trans-cinnamate dioxygenase ferredoxin subunit
VSAPAERVDRRYVVAKAADIPPGERLIVEVAGRSVGIFNIDGKFHAILNRCPHRGGELCKGDVISLIVSDGPGDVRIDPDTKLIACPWHGWEYDLETGQSWYKPGRPDEPTRFPRARAVGVEVESGAEVAEELADGRVTQGENAALLDPKTRRMKGPYVAEILPVDVEDDYVVLSLRRVATPTDP